MPALCSLAVSPSGRLAAVGARLAWSGETMADLGDNVTIPEFSCLLQMDPYLKPYEKDFRRR